MARNASWRACRAEPPRVPGTTGTARGGGIGLPGSVLGAGSFKGGLAEGFAGTGGGLRRGSVGVSEAVSSFELQPVLPSFPTEASRGNSSLDSSHTCGHVGPSSVQTPLRRALLLKNETVRRWVANPELSLVQAGGRLADMVRSRMQPLLGTGWRDAIRWLARLSAVWLGALYVLHAAEAATLRDRFAERESVTETSGTIGGSNIGATIEPGEPRHGRKLGGHSVWISWTAPASGVATFDTAGSDFDTMVAVYRLELADGDRTRLDGLRRAAFGDDDNRQLTSAVDFGVEAGRVYEIAVDGFQGATGQIRLSWRTDVWELAAPEIADQTSDQALRVGDAVNIGFTQLSGENWEMTWLFNGRAIPSPGALSLSIPIFLASNVGRYQLRMRNGSVQLVSPAIELQINSEGSILAMAQDKLLDAPASPIATRERLARGGLRAMAIGVERGYNGQQGFNTLYAAKEPGEPNHCDQPGGASYWIAYQPPASGILTLDTAGSEFDTVLAVYTYEAPLTGYQSLQSVACDDNSGPDGRSSRVQFAVEANREYLVVVDGVGGARGLAFLSYSLGTPPIIVTQPSDTTVVAGESAVLFVSAQGAAPLIYEWRKAGVPIPGATGPELALTTASAEAAGEYSVRVSNGGGSTLSGTATVTVLSRPVFTEQPVSRSVTQGRAVSLRALAVGSPPIEYRWLKDGVLLAGATQSELIFPDVLPGDTGTYAVRASNPAGTTESDWATLTVLTPPQLTLAPAPLTVAQGQRAQFQAAASGSDPLRYQWLRDGVPIDGATQPDLILEPVALDQAGFYSVRVSNPAGNVESPSALLIVLAAPRITLHPASVTVAQGRPVVLRAAAAGSDPLQYQWFKDGRSISGATQSELRLAAAANTDGGSYALRVSNAAGSVESNLAILKIKIPPAFVQHPASLETIQGESAVFRVTVSGSAPLEYQWIKDGIALPGATQPEYSIDTVTATDTGDYSVRVANSAGQAESQSAFLAVIVPPTITEHPAGAQTVQGGTAWFRVTASGTGPLEYQWLKAGAILAGETASILVLREVTAADTGYYSVQVSNRAGSVESARARLSVATPPVITQQPAAVLGVRGGSALFEVKGDGSPPLEYQWLREGVPLAGENGTRLALTNLDPAQAGYYTVRISNAEGSVESWGALLTVLTPPEVIEPLASQSIVAGQRAWFRVNVRGSEPLQYQWYKDGRVLTGARGVELTIASVAPSDEGTYSVRVSNPAGNIEVLPAQLTVQELPQILEPPKSMMVAAGKPAVMTVAAAGSDPLRYQWFKDGVELAGATGDTLRLERAQPNDAASYFVRVTNAAGRADSAAGRLTVLLPASGDIQIDQATRSVVLRLATRTGAGYLLESTEGLSNAAWTPVTSGFAAGNEVSLRISIRPGPALFFRFSSSVVGTPATFNLAPRESP